MLPPHVVRTLSVQLAFSGLTLGFGILALRVAPRPRRGLRLDAWHMSGVTFTTIGAVATVAAVLAIRAAMAGQGTPEYQRFMRLITIGNDARDIAVFGFALALFHSMRMRRPAPPARVEAASMAILLLVGGVLGVVEGAFDPGRQYAVMALIGAATVVVLLAALFAGLVSSSIDWQLWSALAIYAVREAVNTFTQAFIAAGYLSRAWRPSGPPMLWVGAVSLLGMLAFTLARLAVARGTDAEALLERLRISPPR